MSIFSWKFNVKSGELTLGFYKSKEYNQKMKKLNSSLKTQIYNIRFLRLKKEAKKMGKKWKDGPFITLYFAFHLKVQIV